jgi:spore coat polysaccharide biosynthesis predicted glycosyltransferase SpsG
MRVLLRADAGPDRGTGHVMRCLTLGEELTARGHAVALMGSIGTVGWLAEHVRAWGGEVLPCATDELDADRIASAGFDRAVIDSYWIDPAAIAALDARVPTLAIVDGDLRGIEASWYLDQNLGAEDRMAGSGLGARLLAGSRYALVRRAIRVERRPEPWRIRGDRPRVVAFMGGTDPFAAMIGVAESLAAARPDADVLAVTTGELVDRTAAALAPLAGARALPPTDDLPALLGSADVVVSAAGTSAWDVCTLGLPAVLIAVVGNQSESLRQASERGLALGIDAVGQEHADELAQAGGLLVRLLEDEALRRSLSERGREVFDGRGAERVAVALENGPIR